MISGVVLVGAGILQHPSNPDLVLMGRRQGNPVMPGLWEFPGGKHEPGDRTMRHTVEREWREELDLPVEVGELVGLYEAVYGAGRRLVLRTYRVRVARSYDPSVAFHDSLVHRVERHPPGPHSELRWVDFRTAITELPCTPSTHAAWSQDFGVGILLEPWS